MDSGSSDELSEAGVCASLFSSGVGDVRGSAVLSTSCADACEGADAGSLRVGSAVSGFDAAAVLLLRRRRGPPPNTSATVLSGASGSSVLAAIASAFSILRGVHLTVHLCYRCDQHAVHCGVVCSQVLNRPNRHALGSISYQLARRLPTSSCFDCGRLHVPDGVRDHLVAGTAQVLGEFRTQPFLNSGSRSIGGKEDHTQQAENVVVLLYLSESLGNDAQALAGTGVRASGNDESVRTLEGVRLKGLIAGCNIKHDDVVVLLALFQRAQVEVLPRRVGTRWATGSGDCRSRRRTTRCLRPARFALTAGTRPGSGSPSTRQERSAVRSQG